VSGIAHLLTTVGPKVPPCRSVQSICGIRPPSAGHARAISDSQTQDELRKLAAEYIERAAVIERDESE